MITSCVLNRVKVLTNGILGILWEAFRGGGFKENNLSQSKC